MLKIGTDLYGDFKAVAQAMRPDAVFYQQTETPSFYLLAVSRREDGVSVTCGISGESLPGSFSTDFPGAIELTHVPTVS